jgi:hypothetical protein
MVDLQRDRLDRILRIVLPHAGSQLLGLKDAHQPTHNHLPKDNEEVNAQAKCLQAMLDVVTVVDLVLERDDGVWGQEPSGFEAQNL